MESGGRTGNDFIREDRNPASDTDGELIRVFRRKERKVKLMLPKALRKESMEYCRIIVAVLNINAIIFIIQKNYCILEVKQEAGICYEEYCLEYFVW